MTITDPGPSHKGLTFRSELDARWAVFFDAVGLDWQYKARDFGLPGGARYKPDFWLPGWDVFLKTHPRLPYEDVIELDDQAIISVVGPGGPTTLGAFVSASVALQEQDGRVVKPRLHLLCGAPGVPKVRRARGGRWELRAGHACLHLMNGPGVTAFPLGAFALCGGADARLEIWPAYLEGGTTGFRAGLTTPVFPGDYATTVYVGSGVQFDAPRLTRAFAAAQGARFPRGGEAA